MRYFPLFLLSFFMLFQACKKTGTIYHVNAGLKANFGYKPGSYWIYKDSISGEIDSAYVTANQDNYYYAGGCVLEPNEPQIELMSILLSVSNGNSSDTERWHFSMQESEFNIGFYNNKDSVESNIGFNLFTWPLATGIAANSSGCVPGFDSGAVTDVIPEVAVSGQAYTNAARSAHMPFSGGHTRLSYNDCFYVNQKAGIIKIIFDHPADSVHRVLELQRYHLVK